jgi:cytochrome b subunit of formate dehydrogenase
MKGNFTGKVIKGVFWLEAVLALIIITGIIIGSIDLVRYFKMFYESPPLETFSLVRTFLGHALTLIIGLELVTMLVTHTPSSVIEVLLYAVARKMIIESKSMLDILIGVVAIGLLFFINKRFNSGK